MVGLSVGLLFICLMIRVLLHLVHPYRLQSKVKLSKHKHHQRHMKIELWLHRFQCKETPMTAQGNECPQVPRFTQLWEKALWRSILESQPSCFQGHCVFSITCIAIRSASDIPSYIFSFDEVQNMIKGKWKNYLTLHKKKPLQNNSAAPRTLHYNSKKWGREKL